MRIGASLPRAALASLRLTQQTLVQAASHASQPTSKPVTPPDRIEASPASWRVRRSIVDIRV